jgi:DNA-binding MarR family transcriptional regulator/predicted GNAT family N-acyltransferase
MNFYDKIGKIAIGSRLRLLSEQMTTEAAQIYKMYGVELHPKWFPVYYALADGGAKTITAIAKEIGHSHPSVSKIAAEMRKAGLVVEQKDETDKRRNQICLSDEGKIITEKIQNQYLDVNEAIEKLMAQTQQNLWEAIGEWEFLLGQQSLAARVKAAKKQRESAQVVIVEYEKKYQEAFRSLNVEWISTYFKMEEADYKALDNPESYILEKGGFIFVALYDNEPVGVCALIKMDNPTYGYELAKMAVSPKVQGKNIGFLLGQRAVETARQNHAKGVYLESNTMLTPAIRLYHKLGFEKVAGFPTPYERANIKMGLLF